MITFSTEAQALFDRYLQTVRWSVRGVADAYEIERDVREHVDSALREQEAPVSSQTLRDVLSRLGDPWQWIPMEELPWWRRTLMKFSLGPEDWRLAYLTFALTIVGAILLPVGGFVLLIGAWFLARATYALAADRDGTVGPRRWLVYPPLALFAFFVVLVLMVGPAGPVVAWGIGEHGFLRVADHINLPESTRFYREVLQPAAAALVFGLWWIVLSAIVAISTPLLRVVLLPFANRLRRIHALWLTALGAVSAGAGSIVFWMW